MKQEFLHKLEELEKKEKEEEKEKVELYLRRRSPFFRDYLSVFSMILAVLFSVGFGIYSLYLFIDISSINELVDEKVSRNVGLMARSIQGKNYTNSSLGVKNWIVFRSADNGFEFSHPENWRYVEGSEHILEIKKCDVQDKTKESREAVAFLDKFPNDKKLSLSDFASEKTGLEKGLFIEQDLETMKIIRMDGQKDENGFAYSEAFWEQGEQIFSLKAIFYKQDNGSAREEFEKILKTIKIR